MHSPSCERKSGVGHCRTKIARGEEAQQESAGPLQEVSLLAGELEDGAAGGGECRALCGGAFPASGFPHDHPNPAEPAVVWIHDKEDRREQDQGRSATGADDTAELPSFPVQLAAAVGEDVRPVGEKCPLFLVAPDGGPSDEAVVCERVGANSGSASSDGIARAEEVGNSIPRPVRYGGVRENQWSKRPLRVLKIRGGRLRAVRTISERKNAPERLGSMQRRECALVPATKMGIPVQAGSFLGTISLTELSKWQRKL
jgi:hypothetical protein